jgi:Fe-S-cluster containining protein
MSATAVTYSCAGCGAACTTVCAGGIWVPKDRSQSIPYFLCPQCTLDVERDPEQMAARIELRLTRAEGHA